MEKKKYEMPVVTRVEISFSDRIVSVGCGLNTDVIDHPYDCYNSNATS